VREIIGKNVNALITMAEIKNKFRYVEKMIKIVKIAIPRYKRLINRYCLVLACNIVLNIIFTKCNLNLFSFIGRNIRNQNVCRYMLIKAYYYMIQSRKKAAMKMLRQTKKLSIKMDNRMIYAWANHCQQVRYDFLSIAI